MPPMLSTSCRATKDMDQICFVDPILTFLCISRHVESSMETYYENSYFKPRNACMNTHSREEDRHLPVYTSAVRVTPTYCTTRSKPFRTFLIDTSIRGQDSQYNPLNAVILENLNVLDHDIDFFICIKKIASPRSYHGLPKELFSSDLWDIRIEQTIIGMLCSEALRAF